MWPLQDWDQTTIDWFSNKKSGDIPLPTYKLNFLWCAHGGLRGAAAAGAAKGRVCAGSRRLCTPADLVFVCQASRLNCVGTPGL